MADLYFRAHWERTRTQLNATRQVLNAVRGDLDDPDNFDRLVELIQQLEDSGFGIRRKLRKALAHSKARESRDPPMSAEFLLTMLLKPSCAEAVIGDLNERFTDELLRLGQRRAVRLYSARTLRSLWPLLKRATAKALRWGAVIAMARRMF